MLEASDMTNSDLGHGIAPTCWLDCLHLPAANTGTVYGRVNSSRRHARLVVKVRGPGLFGGVRPHSPTLAGRAFMSIVHLSVSATRG